MNHSGSQCSLNLHNVWRALSPQRRGSPGPMRQRYDTTNEGVAIGQNDSMLMVDSVLRLRMALRVNIRVGLLPF